MICVTASAAVMPLAQDFGRSIPEIGGGSSFAEELAGFSASPSEREPVSHAETAAAKVTPNPSSAPQPSDTPARVAKVAQRPRTESGKTTVARRGAKERRFEEVRNASHPRKRQPMAVVVPVQTPIEPDPPLEVGSPQTSDAEAKPAGSSASAQSGESAPEGGVANSKLAFAARLYSDAQQPGSQCEVATAPASESQSPAGNSPPRGFAEPLPDEQSTVPKENGSEKQPAPETPQPDLPVQSMPGMLPAASFIRESTASATPRPEAPSARSAEAVSSSDRSATARPETLRDLSFKLSGPGPEKVEVRLMERAGEVRVAVHTADVDLRRGLGNGLNELVGRLEGTGFQTETWRPPEAEFRQPDSSGRQHQQQGAFSGGREQGRDQQTGSQSQPEWVDEFDQGFRTAGSDSERRKEWQPAYLR